MFTRSNPNNLYPSNKKDIIDEEITRVYSVVASFLDNNNFVIQITIGNHMPSYDNVRLLKMFVCNDEEETQRSLAIIMADKHSFYNRLFQ